MAKRFTDTNKYKKPFLRGLQGAYKVLWDFLYHDCDNAGVWIVDFDMAQHYVGKDLPINKQTALLSFNSDEVRIIELDSGTKWFIPSFIEFQYNKLSENNKAHSAVISTLKKYNLLNNDLSVKKIIKPLTSPLQGDKDKDKDMDNDKEILSESEINLTIEYIDRMGKGKLKPPEIENFWQAFNLNDAEAIYQNRNKKITHFRNWLKNRINGQQDNSTGGKSKLTKSEALTNF